MPARTQDGRQLVFSKPHPWERRNKMHLDMCWPNTSHDSEDSRCISPRDEHTSP